MNRVIISFFVLALAMLIQACRCSCRCEKNMGCRIILLKLNSNDSLIIKKTFCSFSNYTTDKVVADSMLAFISTHQSDSTHLITQDSIFYSERTQHISCKATDQYEQKGYGCECAK